MWNSPKQSFAVYFIPKLMFRWCFWIWNFAWICIICFLNFSSTAISYLLILFTEIVCEVSLNLYPGFEYLCDFCINKSDTWNAIFCMYWSIWLLKGLLFLGFKWERDVGYHILSKKHPLEQGSGTFLKQGAFRKCHQEWLKMSFVLKFKKKGWISWISKFKHFACWIWLIQHSLGHGTYRITYLQRNLVKDLKQLEFSW